MKNEYTPVERVDFKISIDIIEHFSKNLYRSANKAIEELVTNGYDAFAKEVHIYLPGEYLKNSVVVWDDGESMDIPGIQALWHIAHSPKAHSERTVTRGGIERKIVGKFGIGKLASYTLGHKIGHLCKRDGKYLLIAIDYRNLQESLSSNVNGDTPELNKLLDNGQSTDPDRGSVVIEATSEVEKSDESQTYSEQIYELSEDEALDLVIDRFQSSNSNIDRIFEKESWTFAYIDDLKENKITPGMLKRVLGRSMPIRPDFKVFVNDEEIKSILLEKDAIVTLDFGSDALINKLKSLWKSAKGKGRVNGDLQFGNREITVYEKTSNVPVIVFPNLGLVHGMLRLSQQSLHVKDKTKIERFYGFFVYVRERLINSEDDKLFLKDPSYASFYRAQYIIHADDLDDVLLADRERFGDSAKIDEFSILQAACYSAIDTIWNSELEKEEEEKQFKNRIPIHRRDLFADPISMLWSQKIQEEKSHEITDLNFDIDEPKIERESLGEEAPISKVVIEEEGTRLAVNQDHPFLDRQVRNAGKSKRGAEFLREFENLLVMESLFEGHLHYLDIPKDKIRSILEWRDNMYRQLAFIDNENIFAAVQEMHDASFKGGDVFEIAINNVLQLIGFDSRVVSNAGEPDIIALARAGENSYRLVFEAKGSIHDLPNTKAAISAGINHAKAYEAEHVVVIARDFKGFVKSETPAIIAECLAINQSATPSKDLSTSQGNPFMRMKLLGENPTVSVMTTESLGKLAKAVYQFQYDLVSIKDVLTAIESPDEKDRRIDNLANPGNEFDFGELLQIIYAEQHAKPTRLQASISTIFSDYYADGSKGVTTREEFDQKVETLHRLATNHIPKSDDQIALTQKPDIVANHVATKLAILKIEPNVKSS